MGQVNTHTLARRRFLEEIQAKVLRLLSLGVLFGREIVQAITKFTLWSVLERNVGQGCMLVVTWGTACHECWSRCYVFLSFGTLLVMNISQSFMFVVTRGPFRRKIDIC